MAFCPSCGRPVNAGASFCTACGTAMAPVMGAPVASTPVAPAAASTVMERPQVRPAGVTIIAVCLLVVAGLWIFGAVAALILFSAGAAWAMSFAQAWIPWLTALGGAFTALVTIALLAVVVIAGLAIATGAGLLRGREWAWGLTLGYMGLNALTGLVSLGGRNSGGLVSLAVSGLVIWYFFTPEVKRWFGRA